MSGLKELEDAAAIVYGHMLPTPQYSWPLLSERAGCEVWVKHENHTPTGAFKLRGGLVYMTRLRQSQPCVRGVITATRGNHGQSVALAAAKVGLNAVIVVPHGNSPGKNAAMRAFGAELIEYGDDFQEAYDYAVAQAQTRGLHPIRAFDPALVEGVATYGLEFFRAVPDLDTVYVPIGMGSGICGLIAARDALGLSLKIVGVVAKGAPAYALSFEAGRMVATEKAHTIADGVACRTPDEQALEIILDGAARVVRVSDGEIEAAMAHYLSDTHNLAEAAAATPLAALLKERETMAGKKVGLILSGGNADRGAILRALGGGGP